ncbi:uncharacterized protein LOC144127911 isoform X1 [Amblyomma americanum]
MVQCPYCPFVTRFASAIRRHLVRHTKERPHKCHLCPQNFQRRAACPTDRALNRSQAATRAAVPVLPICEPLRERHPQAPAPAHQGAPIPL